MIICSKCGSQFSDEVKFCPNCGNKIIAANPESAPVEFYPQNDNFNYYQTTQATEEQQNISPKSRLAALLLGIFLGRLGVHNFYLGKIGKGIAQVLLFICGLSFYVAGFVKLTLLSVPAKISSVRILSASTYMPVLLIFISVLFLMAVGIWSLVEWILIACGKATDKNGLPVLVWNK